MRSFPTCRPAFRAAADPLHRCGHAAAGQSGAVLIVVILLIALMLSLGAAGTRTAQIELRIAHNDVLSKEALEVAEAGWNHAFGLIKREDSATHLNGAANGFSDELSQDGTGGALAALGSVRTLDDGHRYRFNRLSAQTGDDDGYYVRVVDNQDETAGLNDPVTDRDNTVHIISRGRVATAERVIDTVVQRDGTAPCVICGTLHVPLVPILDMALVGQLATDGFDSRQGGYSPLTATPTGNVLSNGDVSMAGSAPAPITVNGSITAARTVVKVPPVNVSGTTTQFAPPTEFPPVLPCGPPYPANQGVSGQYIYNRALGTLVSVGASLIDFAPGEYCFSSIVMAGGSTLRVTGPTRISLTQPSALTGIVNMTGVAANLRVESSVVSPVPVPPGIVPALGIVGTGGNLAMVINAPQAIVEFAGVTADFYGQIIAGIIPSLSVGQLHYDQALDSPRLYRRGWRELRDYPPA